MGSVIIPAHFLNNVKALGVAKSILFLDVVALFFLNVLYQLLRFIIIIINEKYKLIYDLYNIKTVNLFLACVFLVALIPAVIPESVYSRVITLTVLSLDFLISLF